VCSSDLYGFAYETPDEHKQRSSDLVFGDLLKLEGENGRFFQVSYPDGRKAYVLKTQASLLDQWESSRRLTEESIVQTALTLKGIPYTWGGTSVKGMDCSGFSKTVFLKNGIILERDADQQAATGIPVDISKGYDNLRPGDLMFFGKKATSDKKEYIRHVAIYIGNKEFIQASGYIRISSLDPNKPNYDSYNTSEFIRATRIIGAVGSKGIWKINENPLYQVQK
jgi:cell wall-associated NlpC family hydrolase